MNTPDNAPGWHLKKEIQLGHLITTFTVAASCLLYISKIENRIAVIEAQNMTIKVSQAERDERQDRANSEMSALLRSQLDKMDAKLDRLIENRQRSGAP